MIVKGQPVVDWGSGAHLTSGQDERVEMIGSRGIGSTTIPDAITNLDAF